MSLRRALPFVLLPFFVDASASTQEPALTPEMRALREARPAQPTPLAPMHATPCVDGMAGIYPCSNIDLLAFVPLAEFSAQSTNSLWGWTDPQSGIEYALVGANNGTAFYDLSTPDHPHYLGKLPTHAGTGSSLWRDVRVYANHAYVISDANPGHGLQVFDLTRLRGVTTPQTFTEDGYYGAFGSSHTISINEQSGYAMIAGADINCGSDPTHGGLQILDLSTPAAPSLAGCVPTGGYTHESQCWIYAGPDTAHVGKEICFNANGPSRRIAIVDVSDKSAPVTLSSTTYAGASYPHQGWLSDDHRYLLVDDELDESDSGHTAWTYVWDVSDLEAPVLVGHRDSGLSVIDHNLYVHGQYVYQSNYEAGVRILRIDNLSSAQLTEVAYFDTYPTRDTAEFNGTWNNYRFPGSGRVVATGIDEGFFVLQPQLCVPPAAPDGLAATPNGDGRIDLSWTASATPGAHYRVERAQGGCSGSFETIADALAASTYSDTGASGSVTYGYRVVAGDDGGQCVSPASTCVEAETTGACIAPPLFAGIAAATNAAASECRVQLAWNAAQPACGGPASYSIHRGGSVDFVPSESNRIAQDVDLLTYLDIGVAGGAPQYYVVRSTDDANGATDRNLVRLAVTPTGPNVDGTFASGAEPGDPLFEAEAVEVPVLSRSGNQIFHAGWHPSTARVHGGAQSFWSTNENNLCVTLVTPELQLTAAQESTLSFWSVWDTQQGRDGGVVEISTDAGANWTRLTPLGGYPGTINSGGTLCGVAVGSGAFTGLGHFTWSPQEVDLSAYAGQTVKLRWLYRSDQSTNGEGWFVDDVALTHAQVPGMCVADSERIFVDGFDATP
ncbi:choice-of-anchor B family protein [Dokdonella sp.]|uniref:choice-of-anchor B family protein n=1 Tax=Dokdonella sp. TaxID=2291710 RepID=UPI001B01305F|nr:choice-of-anchor B family protein [Dokdonella sp.]MBO9662132.1 choice-of-anchor B family protein [Dokdonella sp.]